MAGLCAKRPTRATDDKWGDIAGSGYPPSRHQWILDEGEQVVTLSVKKLGNDSWIGQFRTPKVVATISIDAKDFFQSSESSSRNATVGSKTMKIDDSGKLLLMRSRVTPSNQSKLLDKDDPLLVLSFGSSSNKQWNPS